MPWGIRIFAKNFEMNNNLFKSLAFIFLLVSCQPSVEELFEAGVTSLEGEKYEESISYFDRLVARDSTHAAAWNARGVAFFELGQWDEAINSFSQSIESDSLNYKPYFNRGNAWMEKESFKEALIDYNRANGLDRGQSDIYYNRGLALLGLEMYEDALIDFDMALQASPEQPTVLLTKPKPSWETTTLWRPFPHLMRWCDWINGMHRPTTYLELPK